jgi:hypothetical protein
MTDAATFSRLFTIEDANSMLPLVKAITSDLAELSREVIERRERLAALRSSRPAKQSRDAYADELSQIEEELEKDTARLREYVEELRALAVEPKNGPEGLVDFPAMMDGRVVFLCWRLGEPEVLHWHELEAGFAGRQPLCAETISGGADVEDTNSCE